MSGLTVIVAATVTNGIGIVQGSTSSLPWRLPKELAFFARVTKFAPNGAKNAVIMGRRTWESIPPKMRPLKDRLNIVLSRSQALSVNGQDTQACTSLSDALSRLEGGSEAIHRTYIIGGAAVYQEAITGADEVRADRIVLTRVLSPAFEDCNVFFPAFEDDPSWSKSTADELDQWVGFEVPRGVQEERGVEYEHQMWVRKKE